MADSESLLQLGIDAAREGRREDARNLFGLLTRQDPDNAQAWLWLAGVAEGPEQRRAALERVVELEPTNEMAIKGLQAMGAAPAPRTAAPAVAEAAAVPEAPPPPPPAREMTDEERYAAELDSAFDDYDALPRAETSRRDPDETDVIGAGAYAAEAGRTTPRGSARDRVAARRATTPIRSDEDDEDLYGPPPRRPSRLLIGLLAAIVLVLLAYLLWTIVSGRNNRQTASTGGAATAAAQATTAAGGGQATPGLGGTGTLSGTGELSGTAPLTSTSPLTTTGGVAGGGTPAGEQPTATAGGQPAGGGQAAGGGQIPAPQANPSLQPVAVGSTLESNGWTYTYPNANYSVVLGKQVGSFTANGTYVHVLVWVANNTGTAQPLPANFFALKDAGNNVYTAAPQVSSVAVQRGVTADLGMEDAVPANGVLTSVYLVFDVPPGTQGLTLFAAGNNGQGWPIGIVP